jgi:hypothetical protein
MKKHDVLQKLIIMGFLVFLIFVSFVFYMRDSGKSERLTQVEETQKIHNIQFYGKFWRVASIVGSSSLLVIVVVVAACYGKAHLNRASVYILKIANSEVPISIKEIRHGVSEYALGLINAEQLERRNAGAEKALQLYEALANSEMKRLSALSKFVPSHQSSLSPLLSDGTERQIAPHIPSFSEMLDSGDLQKGSPMVFGYSLSGIPRTGTYDDVYSCGSMGKTGTGKTTSIRHSLAASLLTGQIGQAIIMDYHYPHKKSLISTLGNLARHPRITFFDNTENFGSLRSAVEAFIQKEILSEIDRRLRLKDAEYDPWLIIVDEVLSFCRLTPIMSEMMLRVGTEARKVEMYGEFSAQTWLSNKRLATDVRDGLASKLIHQSEPSQANLLLHDYKQAKQAANLQRGQALFSPTNGAAEVLIIPPNTVQDMNRVATMLEGNAVKRLDAQPIQEPEYLQIKNTLLEKYPSQKAIAQAAEVGEVDVCRYFKNGMGNSEKIQKIKRLI